MIRIGPAGNSLAFYESGRKHTVDAPEWLREIGLNAYEYSFGRGITLSEKTAIEIGQKAIENDIAVSVHAPYYINFANPDPEMINKSIDYVLRSVKMVKLLSGNRVVMHSATCGKMKRDQAVYLAKSNIDKMLSVLEETLDFDDYIICPETMGKLQQIGMVEEIVDFCKLSDKMIPCFDFGHINSYSHGSLKTEEDYKRIIDYTFEHLGEYKTKNMHIHFSKIMYGPSGEIRHLTFEDDVYGPEYEPLAKIIDKYGLTPVIICESKEIMSDDALKIKKCHQNT